MENKREHAISSRCSVGIVLAVSAFLSATCGETKHSESGADADNTDAGIENDTDDIPPWFNNLEECDFDALSGCFEGSVILDDASDVAAFAAYPCITGAVFITGDELKSVELPALEQACYLMAQDSATLNAVSLPALTLVERDLLVADVEALTTFDAPSLGEVGGTAMFSNVNALSSLEGLPSLALVEDLWIDYCPGFEEIELPSLTTVQGDLKIIESESIETFRAPLLAGAGDVDIYRNDVLARLELPSLATVDNGISLEDMPNLSEIDCTGLHTSGLSLNDLDALQSLEGFSALEESAWLGFLRVDSLTSLSGMSQLKSLGSIHITDCESLVSLDGLTSLETLSGGMSIELNAALESLGDLTSLTSIGGDLVIHGSPGLSDISGLASLQSLGGWLMIFGTSLSDISTLYGITSFTGGNADISYCPYLPTCEVEALFDHFATIGWSGSGSAFADGIDACATTTPEACGGVVHDGTVVVGSTDEFAALAGVTRINGNLQIWGLEADADLSALSDLECVSGDIIIRETGLTHLDTFDALWFLGGILDLGMNDDLVDFEGFSSLSFAGGISLWQLESNISLTGLSNLTSIGDGGLNLNDIAVENLAGLESVSSISGGLSLYGNCELTTLDALYGLNTLGGDLFVSNNASLYDGEAEALAAQLTDSGWTGEADIGQAYYSGSCNSDTDDDG